MERTSTVENVAASRVLPQQIRTRRIWGERHYELDNESFGFNIGLLEDPDTYHEHDMYGHKQDSDRAYSAKRNNIHYTDVFVPWPSAPAAALADGQRERKQ